uniref:EKC/KEOPS complex subunit GON7 n=1 Tax=Panagrellus redivivus TaxID=6233 RepID=A0A7E4ZQP6_PANRE
MADQTPLNQETPAKSVKRVEFATPTTTKNVSSVASRQSTPFPKEKHLQFNVTPKNANMTSSSSIYTPDDRLAAGDLTSFIEAAVSSSFTAGDLSFADDDVEAVKYDVAELVDALQERVVSQIQDLKLRLLNEIDQAYKLPEDDDLSVTSPNAH